MNVRLTYWPALDGLRAVAVVMVLLFHQGFGWMSGGYIGVSLFFTLSGFLITSLLVAEHESTGSIDLADFYARRLRRLIPAAVVCLGGISVAAAAGAFPLVDGLDRAVLAALAQVANWEMLTDGSTYAEMLAGGAEPTAHFWSLAVEEQFYWVWPIAVGVIWGLARHRRGRVLAVATAAIVTVAAAPLIALIWGPDVAYWSTPARLGEILTGALLAVVMRGSSLTPGHRRLVAGLGAAAVPLLVAAAVVLPRTGGPAYDGWLGVGSLVSCAVIAASTVAGPVRRGLSARPLVALGRVSYGVYLFHWPLFLTIDPGDDSLGSFVVRLAATLVVAGSSYVLVERPARTVTWPLVPTASVAMSSVVVVAGLALVVVPPGEDYLLGSANDPTVTIAPVVGTLPVLGTVPVESPDSSAPSTTVVEPAANLFGAASTPIVPSRPVRILVLGDSTAHALGTGLVEWAVGSPSTAQVTVLASPGCGVLPWSDVELAADGGMEETCEEIRRVRLPEVLESSPPDLVVVLVTLADATERRWSDEEGTLSSTDPRYRERLVAAYRTLGEQLLDIGGTRVAWFTAAPPAEWFVGHLTRRFDPGLWDAQRAAISAVAADTRVTMVDFGAWLTGREQLGERYWRPDGLHLGRQTVTSLVETDIGPGLIGIALDQWPATETAVSTSG